MKRVAFYSGLALWLAVAAGCANHDTETPDTSGNDPQNPNRTAPTDTSGGVNVGTNMNNGTYSTQGDSAGRDTSTNRQ